jgi:ethanolamine-phosphate cytidylyltransferase
MNIHERTLNVLSCKWVDDVVIGAPWNPTKDLVLTIGAKIVVCGSRCKLHEIDSDPYAEPKSLGVYKPFWPEELGGSEHDRPFLSTDDVISRVIANHQKFMERNSKKSTKEKEYYQTSKVYVPEV